MSHSPDPPVPADTAVTVIGEALIDLVPAGGEGLWRAAPGGSPANVAVGLARLRVPTRMGARLSGDVFGRVLREHLTGNGVDLSGAVDAAEPTSLAIVSVAADGSAEYDFRVDRTADWQWTDEELAALIPRVRHAALHTGSLAATTAPGAAAVLRAFRSAQATATLSYDPNCRPLLMGDRVETVGQVEELIAVCDVVKASEEDARWLYPDRSPAAVADHWATLGPALVALTLGAEGALAVGTLGEVRVPGRPVAVVDTVGAGDSFMSALLAGLAGRGLLGADRRADLHRLGPDVVRELLGEAVAASALTCTRAGAQPPTASELQQALRDEWTDQRKG